jgi:AcrR family transcriptional regulator
MTTRTSHDLPAKLAPHPSVDDPRKQDLPDGAAVPESSLRDQQQQLTREIILRSVADQLESGDLSEITVPDVARSAGVSVRTVYRHFASREDLIREAAEWISAHLFGASLMPETVAELAADYRENLVAFDEHPMLVRAMAVSRAGNSVRSARRERRLESLGRALGEVTDNLSQEERRQAEALFGYLVNMLAWVTMRDEYGLSGAQIATAMDWALGTLIDDLRRRNEAAGANLGNQTRS